jgi:hypothetical protein
MAIEQRSVPTADGATPGVVRPQWNSQSWEARLLASSLRCGPVTLLHGASAAERSACLRQGLLPLLARRAHDRALPARRGQVLAFPRRGPQLHDRDAHTQAELVVLLGPGQRQPVRTLAQALADAAVDRRVLLLLDGFERLLSGRQLNGKPARLEAEALLRRLDSEMRSGQRPLHVLLATDDPQSPALRELAGRWPGFGDQALRLDERRPSAPPRPQPVAVPVVVPVVVPVRALEPPPAAPPDVELPGPDWPAAEDTRPGVAHMDEQPAPFIEALHPSPRNDVPPPVRQAGVKATAAAALAGLVALAILAPRLLPPVAAEPEAHIASVTAPAAAQPAWPTEPGLALQRVLGAWPLRDLRQASAATAGTAASLLLLRYDGLQDLAARWPGSAVRLVAPLFVEPVQVLVPDASPLRHLHELAGRRVDIGRDTGATPTGVLAALGSAPGSLSRLDDSSALAALRRGDIDAVLRVGVLPGPATGLRPLLLDRSHPSAAEALQRYLPMRWGAGDTLGVMSFLASAGAQPAEVERLAAGSLQTLCLALPALRMQAHPVWATVQPTHTLPAGLPYADATRALAGRCETASAAVPSPLPDPPPSQS